ncbi:hypothetical protein ACJJTC_016178 [Scirpophaga incertulas]
MDHNIKKCCPNCSQFYQLNQISPHSKRNIPLLLACGHSMCEICIKNIVKFLEPIECKICHRDMQIKQSDVTFLSENKYNLYKLFPVNMLMLGELAFQYLEGSNEVNENKDGDYYINLQAVINNSDIVQGVCVECNNPTTKICQQCSSMLCNMCFTKSHKNFIIFKNHVLVNFLSDMDNMNTCLIHKDKYLDYYCNDCTKTICMDCMMVGGEQSCKNHNVVSMQEVNGKIIDELAQLTPQVDETLKRLSKTAVDIGNLLYNIDNNIGPTSDLTNIINNIEQHFSKLCSQIQKHKDNAIDVIAKLKHSEIESLKNARENIKSSLERSKKLLDLLKTTDSSILKQINVAELLNKAKEVIELPWYLNKTVNNDELKVTVKEDLCTLVTEYIKIEGTAETSYKLIATSELGDIKIPPPPSCLVYPPELPKDVRQKHKPKPELMKESQKPNFYVSVPKYRSKSGSISSLNSNESDSSLKIQYRRGANPAIQTVPPFQESRHPKELQEGSQELIYISHIVNPHNFYVQRACHQKIVKDMLKEFRNATSLPKPSINHVSEGKLYLMFNKADNMWQRSRIISIERKDTEKPLYRVFCIDFGSTEIVPIDKLRLLPSHRLQSPCPLAINCTLANCEPKSGSWTSDDSILIQNIIDNKQAVIHVRHIQSMSNFCKKFECDVTTFEEGVSITHALVFHERAKLTNPKLPYPNIVGILERPKLYMGNNDFKQKEIETVYITHIVSPDKFFVMKKHLKTVYEKICDDMEQEYNLSVNTGSIYLPEVGMVCVVNTEKYRSEGEFAPWMRAIVKELPGRGRVRVQLPDCGAVLLVHWSALRHIHPKFTTLRGLSTECYLAGVTPLKKKWSPGSVALLHKFEGRLLELHVEDARNHGSIGVAIYDRSDSDEEVCINKEMIRHKFAISFGMNIFNKKDVEEQVITNKSPLQELKPMKKQPKKNEIQILKREMPPKKNVKDEDLEAKDKGPLRLEAKVLSYQSPSLLHVALVHQQKFFSELFEKIQAYYSKFTKGKKNDWDIAEKCCAFCNQSQTWRRATIIGLENESIKVFYSDFACVDIVPVSNVRELVSEFSTIGDAAIRCHLSGISPAIGDQWPSLSKECLQELLDAYPRIYITKVGNFDNMSMPVEIWAYHTVQGGALEPNKSEWRRLNDELVKQGLAVPERNPEGSCPETSKNDDEMLSFLNITGSVNDWLQLDSVAIKPPVCVSDTESTSSHQEACKDSELKAPEIEIISDWLPPEPLSNMEFIGMPTYIDHEGNIFLHNVIQEETLDMIRRALEVRFNKPDPKSKYTKWTIGEPCVAMYYLDNRFYRGRVTEVNEEAQKCMIHYVDYGNEEECTFTNLRKSIVLHQIPIQANKCVLAHIVPIDEHWDRQALDYVHKTVVEKECFVKVCGDSKNGVIPIELKYNKLCINDHLVDLEFATYIDNKKPIVRKYAQAVVQKAVNENIIIESDSGPDYIVEEDSETSDCLATSKESSLNVQSIEGIDWIKMMDEDENPKATSFLAYSKITNEEFLCNITIINDAKSLDLNIIHDDETNLLYEEMFEKLQQYGENMARLNGIFENKACVARFYEDGKWYRASILQYSKTLNKVKVRYVDYGNIEVLSLSDIREIDPEFIKLLPITVQVKLYAVELNPDVNLSTITQEFSNTFLDKGPFKAKVMKIENSVPIVELRDENEELVYKDLIKTGVFTYSVE